MKNLRVVKVIYVLLQGAFLPLIIRADTLLDNGQAMAGLATYVIYTLLVFGDAVIALKLFGRR